MPDNHQQRMDPVLADFLAHRTPGAQFEARWADGRIVLAVTAYLGDDEPPPALVTSVRAIVVQPTSGQILVVTDAEGEHIVPGGRCEPGETVVDTVRREVLEETGWLIDDLVRLGFIHCRHQTPPPPEFATAPYPDFIQLVYLAMAVGELPSARQTDGPELGADFWALAVVEALPLSAGERLFLAEARRRHWLWSVESEAGA